MTTPNTISLLAAAPFATALQEAGFDVRTGATIKDAAIQARSQMATVPVLMIPSDDYAIPAAVMQTLGARAIASHVVDAFPVSVGKIAEALQLEIADEHRSALLASDATITAPQPQAEPADEWDDLFTEQPQAEQQPAVVADSTGWEDDEDEVEAAPAPVVDAAPAYEFPSLDDEPAAAPPVEAPVEEQGRWLLSEQRDFEPQFDDLLAEAKVDAETELAQPISRRDARLQQQQQPQQQQPVEQPQPARPISVPAPIPAATAYAQPAPIAPQPAPVQPAVQQAEPAGEISNAQLLAILAQRGINIPAPVDEADDTLNAIADRNRSQGTRATSRRNAEILIPWAGGGGVGKTTTTLVAAQIAAEAGLSVLVVDANRGQPDVTKMLTRRSSDPTLPTIHSATLTDDVHVAVCTADRINTIRQATGASEIGFDVVFGPEQDTHSLQLHNATLYRRVIDQLRLEYDLIVIDTQILDNDLSDLWSELHMPLIAAGAWSVGITDPTTAKQSDLKAQLTRFSQRHLPFAKALVIGSMYDEFTEDDHVAFERVFQPARFIGSTLRSNTFKQDMQGGSAVVTSDAGVTPVVKRILASVFPQQPAFQPDPEPAGRGWGLFRRNRR